MKSRIVFMLSFVSISVALSQSNYGPRLTAMGNSGAALTDCWSTSANPALIAAVTPVSVAVNYQKLLVDVPITNQAFSFICPLNKNAIGFYLQKYGLDDYNKIQISGMLSKKFGELFALAFRGNYHRLKITNYGNSTAFSADFGVAFFPIKILSIGVYMNNISIGMQNHTNLKNKPANSIITGVAYAFSDWLTIAYNLNIVGSEIENTCGLEYRLTKNFCIRGGLSTNPASKHMGFGLNLQKFEIDFAIARTAFLSYSPQIGLGYAF